MKFLVILSLFAYHNIYAWDIQLRHSFSISVNKNNDLLIESELHDITELGDMLYHYYTDNAKGIDNAPSSAAYYSFKKENCLLEKRKVETIIKHMDSLGQSNVYNEKSLKRWNSRLYVMNYLNLKSCMFMGVNSCIQIKMRAATSYNTYIQILTEIKKTVNRLRDEKARELFAYSYRAIIENQDMHEMRKRLYVLKLLVPERIVEPPILN